MLVINSKAFAHLTKDQRAAVAKAAAATQTWAIANIPTDRTAAAAYCADGRKIVGATQAELTALEKAAQPVVDQFTRNGGNAAVIAAIRSVVATRRARPIATVACPRLASSARTQASDVLLVSAQRPGHRKNNCAFCCSMSA